MNSEKFLATIESNLTPMAPEFIPGIIKTQMEQLDISYKGMDPANARLFICNVAEALSLFIGPSGSNNAKKFMMRELRKCCNENEKLSLFDY